jgi:hypothetical protein
MTTPPRRPCPTCGSIPHEPACASRPGPKRKPESELYQQHPLKLPPALIERLHRCSKKHAKPVNRLVTDAIEYYLDSFLKFS